MKFPLCLLTLWLACGPAFGQHAHPAASDPRPATLLKGLGRHSFPVSTTSAEAQKFFDQGVILVYGFNHDEAARSFRRAAELDPRMAMAHWGVALALGPNYNQTSISGAKMKEALEAVRRGLALAARAPEHERAYLEALAKRFSDAGDADQRALSTSYSEAMRELARRYPDDAEAATLYADSLMILNAWKLWGSDGRPAAGTEEIVSTLEAVLRRHPEHVGAHHLYIHAVEASPHPEWALTSAERLGGLTPAAGHLVHMPAHIYMRVGDYEAAARSNDLAAEADRAYIESSGLRGVYSAGYYSHNLHFLAAARSMQGRYADSIRAARQLEANVRPYLKEIPPLETFLPTATLTMVRFGRWDEVLREPEPPASQPITRALWRWARGMAYAGAGKVPEAERELKTFQTAAAAIPADTGYGQNTARDVLKIGEHFLDARISSARGDRKGAVEHLRRAVAAEDALAYDEPPGWYHPLSRESLGGALMAAGEHAEAERVFREDLRRNRRNGRSLFGLSESLKAQGKLYEAQLVRREFESAWKDADTTLRVEDL
jgi:tetratricopeptide (TPR) repeat protein